ncbi:hypothetical protein [Pandoraea terrigena]|uniref:Transmembrane protein n=1 Tax=Pandoraea terrigena TaxID=2508292 RepID=A0A5E4U4C5_9BURK|nr:hypothetical protein [Pandoraea terrigena]VVD93019.1 hypothetical protein PTE31013_01738 [Pandoraea terrigena]
MPSLPRLRGLRHTCHGLRTVCLVALAFALVAGTAPATAISASARTATTKPSAKGPRKLPPFEFAVLGNTPFSNTDVPVVRSVLASIGDSQAAFVVHAGNLKSVAESCHDELVTERLSLLASSPKPLVYVPGANDWADCQRANEGGYNAVERLDFLRDHAFNDDAMLGPGPAGHAPFDLTRQSDMARFRQYHENVRWFYGGVVFVGLNLPGNNNNYRSAGGRNGEFEDRAVATRVWLQHAIVYAKQKGAIGMVIIAQADPAFEPARGGGLRGLFSDRAGRRGVDGYKEFRLQLLRLTNRFREPVLLIDSGKTMRHVQPLRDARGALVKSFTQLSTYGSPTTNQWVRVRVEPGTSSLFHFEAVTLPSNRAAAPNAPRASGMSPVPAAASAGAAPSAPGSLPYAAPYSALYPSSGTSNDLDPSASDPNQGVMPIGPALRPNMDARPTRHAH